MSSHQLRNGRRTIIGQSYILTFVCHARQRCFDSPDAARIVTQQIAVMEARGLLSSYAWVVMPDHVHWMFELLDQSLGYLAQRFKSSTALRIRRECGHCGPVWQAAYHDHAIRSDESLQRHAMYVVANPVRAGLVESLGQYPFAWGRWL
ncbi:MAG: transposase [Stenotrophomonas sp.]|jgi:REP element-mobilizing transposase RayT|nr:transposase [Stenotrophomonas sp.]